MNRRHTTTSIPFTSTFESIAVYNLPGFPSFTDVNVGNLTEGAVAFWQSFCQHQDLLAEYIRSFRFDQFDFAVSVPCDVSDRSAALSGLSVAP